MVVADTVNQRTGCDCWGSGISSSAVREIWESLVFATCANILFSTVIRSSCYRKRSLTASLWFCQQMYMLSLTLPITGVHIFLLLVTIRGSLRSSRCRRCLAGFSFPPTDIHTQPGFTTHPPPLPTSIHLSSALVSAEGMCKLSCFKYPCPPQAYSFRWGGRHGGVHLMKEEGKAVGSV